MTKKHYENFNIKSMNRVIKIFRLYPNLMIPYSLIKNHVNKMHPYSLDSVLIWLTNNGIIVKHKAMSSDHMVGEFYKWIGEFSEINLDVAKKKNI